MGTGYIAHHCVECGSSYYGGMTGRPIACPYCVIIQLQTLLQTTRSPLIGFTVILSDEFKPPIRDIIKKIDEALKPND